jgi:EF-hand domain pair
MSVRSFASALGVVLLMALSSVSAKAELSDVVVLFVLADENGDRALSKAEVLIVALRQFNEVDSDRDGSIEKNELGDLAKDPEFTDNDSDKSGSLSVSEVITEKLADFKAADSNGDGVLSLDEVKKFYAN